MRAAVQISFNGHGHTVVAGMAAALAHVEHNLNGPFRIEPFAEAYPMLAAVGVEIGLVPRLAQIAKEQGRESIVLTFHDLDAAPGERTATRSYDLLDLKSPEAVIAMALMEAEDTTEDLSEIREKMVEVVRSAFAGVVADSGGRPEVVLASLRSVRDDLMVSSSGNPFVDLSYLFRKGDPADEYVARAIEAFDGISTTAFPEEAAPSPM